MEENETIDAEATNVEVPEGSAELKAATPAPADDGTILRQILSDRSVTLKPSTVDANGDLFLWYAIEQSTLALSFNNYYDFINVVMCRDEDGAYKRERYAHITERIINLYPRRALPYTDMDSYKLLKIATEAFVTVHGGVLKPDAFPSADLSEILRRGGATADDLRALWDDYLEAINGYPQRTIPYLLLIKKKLGESTLLGIEVDSEGKDVVEAFRLCEGILAEKLTQPFFIELIWSYWQEQGMLVQTMNAISRRFQNVRGPAAHDPLALVEIDALRPLNNLLWGYVQDEQHRLSLVRRAYEYDHHYGLALEGKAVPSLRPADSRSRFLESFHNLLRITAAFYRQRDDVTIRADAFPVLNALKDVHLVLSEGAHGQFGDLPTTARIEMLMQQWILARPEFREFLPTRIMVAHPEPWMDRVDSMRKLQGWGDANIAHFRDLAMFGEQLLLSVRYGAWSDVSNPDQANVWANFWRAQVQGYIHAYQTVTGVDLSAISTMDQDRSAITAQPSTLIQRRLSQGSRPTLQLSSSGQTAPVASSNLRKRLTARREKGA